ncbi:MAG: amidohydrolase family protein, partial [Oscillospiraceae bacterium]|nr:amidohydrolase family protein [Oscillospiraceae bacterium]
SLDFIILHGTCAHLMTDALRRGNVPVMSGPFLSERSKPELRELTPASPGILNKAGIKISIVTDHPVIPVQYLPLCAGLAAREGMDHYEALKAITINAAELAGVSDRVGSIAVGKDADFALFKDDPLTLAAKPRMVFVNGNLISMQN